MIPKLKRLLKPIFKNVTDTLGFYSPTSFYKGIPAVVTRFEPYLSETGLTDRLRHILSIYLFCKMGGFNFRINHINPFRLEEILLPASYDWRIEDSEVCRSLWRKNVVKVFSYYKAKGISEGAESLQQEAYIRSLLTRHDTQYHIYGNTHIMKERWHEAFTELFTPSPLLQKHLDHLTLPEGYEAVTLRFQSLLGDFKESWYRALPEADAHALIDRCIAEIDQMYKDGHFSTKKLLLTSDSQTFLRTASATLPYVSMIPGEMAHFSQKGAGTDVYLKSFIDLIALRGADKITLLKTDDMYLSGFPEFAAVIGNKHFSVHKF